MTSKHQIQIFANKPFAKAIRGTFSALVLTATPILIGVWVGSAAMQWLGFIFGILLLLGMAFSNQSKNTFASTDEARAYLDKIDRGDA
jgi:hypothetical protein